VPIDIGGYIGRHGKKINHTLERTKLFVISAQTKILEEISQLRICRLDFGANF
jgi:hypothetical protein